jgi:NAD(P)-dependent dehydrogenase (short-subunit alcohol dehydrogenase family)
MAKCALVTGGSRGIGRAIATALAQAGCDVVLVARQPGALGAAAADIAAQTGRTVRVIAADLGSLHGVQAVSAQLRGFSPTLDVLVNNAGATVRGTLLEVAEQDWQEGFALKFFGAVRLTRALWPLLKQAQGAVVNIAGVAGRTPSADFVVGSAVNAAVMSLTKSLAAQGATDGVRVNAINPGLIATGRLERRIDVVAAREGVDRQAAARILAAEWGAARIGQPEEIAAMAVFLTVGGGTYCQGGIYDVDGGVTKSL